MKKVIVLILAVLMIPAMAVAKGGGAKKTGPMNVQVKDAQVFAKPDYMGKKIGKLNYGEQVIVVGEEGNWYQITSPAGYVPKSSLTKSKVKLDADQKFSQGTSAKQDEVALAGKGFNPQVEAKYKKDNPNLAGAYNSLDQVQKNGATDAELRVFKTAGKLK